MFENDRYITNGVKFNVPLYLQNLIWFLIETMDVEIKDYLQVFELEEIIENQETKQKIIHIQELPEYRKEHVISGSTTITTKLFVIDDGDHSTLLLAEEY